MTSDLPSATQSSLGRGASSGAAIAANLISFPDVIETNDDSPILLDAVLGTGETAVRGDGGLQVVGINGIDIPTLAPTPLPGVRVGEEDGGGYVLRRALDGKLVFVPDANFSGITTFTFTVADTFGDRVSLLATINILPDIGLAPEIAFVDGTHSAVVAEGTDAAILGVLAISGTEIGAHHNYQVFEGDSDQPSQRFIVSGDKLKVVDPLDHGDDGLIHLRIVARDGQDVVSSDDFFIEVRQAGLEDSAAAILAAHAARDHFRFQPSADDIPSAPELHEALDDSSALDIDGQAVVADEALPLPDALHHDIGTAHPGGGTPSDSSDILG